MRAEALYLNGIFRQVLEDIANVHQNRPGLQLFLQPYSASAITHLRDDPPDKLDPIRLYASTTDDLAHVSFVADIIRWEDKTAMRPERKARVKQRLKDYQPTEEGLYNVPEDGISRNLICVLRMEQLDKPFCVRNLVRTGNNEPLRVRTQSGGWAYVFPRTEDIVA